MFNSFNSHKGLLEKPNIPPSIKVLHFKLYLVGKGGVGKTSLVSYLSGAPDWTNAHHQGETPGVRATQIYWPTRIQSQIIMFQLDLWDSGETASKKYGHILPVSQVKPNTKSYIVVYNLI